MANHDDSFIEFNNYCKDIENLLVFHQNIRSLRENFNAFIMYLSRLDKPPDVIVLSEVWINNSEKDLFSINGYNQFAYCNVSYRSGGVMIYVSEQYKVNSNAMDNMFSADSIKVTINLSNTDYSVSLAIIAVYRLHSHSVKYFIGD